MIVDLQQAVPIEFTEAIESPKPTEADPSSTPEQQPAQSVDSKYDLDRIKTYVIGTKRALRNRRVDKQSIWDECWQLYRGLEDWSDKEDWQSKIVLPKVWASVKQVVNVLCRLLEVAPKPWLIEPYNSNDTLEQLRGELNTELVKFFLDKANFAYEFEVGLESGFVTGVGVWKLWWGMHPRVTVVQQLGPDGRPQLVKKTVQDGRLFIRAVDPYNFWWLPGSTATHLVGTIEELEIPKWELLRMADAGVFEREVIEKLQPMQVDEAQKKEMFRHQERRSQSAATEALATIKLLEYYGPIVVDDQVIEEHGHVIIANDAVVLRCGRNEMWFDMPPYVMFSPLLVPFRTDGMGIVEMARALNKALNRITNMSVDTLMFKLAPMFEVNADVYENPEDLETGIVPGKILRKSVIGQMQPGITPVPMEDISAGSVQVGAALDRYHQEAALVSEIQQSLPRWRGDQTATEIELKQQNQDTFFGALASSIEKNAVKPIIEMAMNLVFQFLDTANDPKVAAILGLDIGTFLGYSKEELFEIISGDYKIKVSGITDQLDKASMLQNLVQLMNIIGQNPEAWMPYVNQDKLLKRILEAFRPNIDKISEIITDPETAAMKQQQQQQQGMVPQLLEMVPTLMQLLQTQQQMQQQQQAQAAQQELAQRQQLAAEVKMLADIDKAKKEAANAASTKAE